MITNVKVKKSPSPLFPLQQASFGLQLSFLLKIHQCFAPNSGYLSILELHKDKNT